MQAREPGRSEQTIAPRDRRSRTEQTTRFGFSSAYPCYFGGVLTASVSSTSRLLTRTFGCEASAAAEAFSLRPLTSPAARFGGRTRFSVKSFVPVLTVAVSTRAPAGN